MSSGALRCTERAEVSRLKLNVAERAGVAQGFGPAGRKTEVNPAFQGVSDKHQFAALFRVFSGTVPGSNDRGERIHNGN